MSGAITGVDISSWQHGDNRAIDWRAVKDAGHAFAMIKATQGDTYTNPWLLEDIAQARAAGLLVGTYHFYEAGTDAALQAQRFLLVTQGLEFELGVWIDWEPGPLADYAAQIGYNALLEAISEVRHPVGLYCDKSWRATFARLNLTVHRCWLADWAASDPDEGEFMRQTGMGTVPGIEGEVDLDVLLVTRGVNLKTAPATPPPPMKPDAEVAEEPTPIADDAIGSEPQGTESPPT